MTLETGVRKEYEMKLTILVQVPLKVKSEARSRAKGVYLFWVGENREGEISRKKNMQ